ncbi:MAG: hypothetical protein AYK19_02315 [Theionarchaea archaeon DG-70-1]|nr:MAG: hypothetical protein AYK19_02315 [Theionarchaea archaeon DG-70-1]
MSKRGDKTDRIDIKTSENQLRQEFIHGFGYPPKIADELVKTVIQHLESNCGNLRKEGQIIYEAVAKEEPVGKSLKKCKVVPVRLTLFAKEDRDILKKKGRQALRRHRIVRMCQEALEQGGLLTQEDLGQLLTTSVRTVRGDIAHLRRTGVTVPTRGSHR